MLFEMCSIQCNLFMIVKKMLHRIAQNRAHGCYYGEH